MEIMNKTLVMSVSALLSWYVLIHVVTKVA